MKLVRFGPAGQEKPGIVDGSGRVRDLSGTVPDIDGTTLGRAELDRLRAIDPESLPLAPAEEATPPAPLSHGALRGSPLAARGMWGP